ncbi:MAG TPA: protein kinase [Thermoanaerobaculia bacterium]|nr:protein kinase [Thermoanaerobaculia bacterium]
MKIGKYQLQDLLGKGGMGEVWRAVDESLKREVAVKVLPAATAADPDFRARFLREARLAARLNHPHIATIFAVEEHDSELYLVMELVKGESLDRVIARGPIAPSKAIEIMLEVASAIAEAHAFGIIHRDIKPENIMIAANGVKVLDFGVAREIHGSKLTQVGVVMGTPDYMSPEQVQGRLLDAQSDIFSLGTVLYEMLSGRKPFEGDSAVDVFIEIVSKPHPPLTNVPRFVAAAVDRCLAKNPADRFRSAAELAEALSFLEPDRVRLRALIADDDGVTRLLLRAHLEAMGYDVDEAVDGSEAISRLKNGEYAVLITDLLMPRLDGWNVLDFIRSYVARRPAKVFVTSMMRDVTISDADRNFVRGVIAKPITAAQLRDVLAAT